MSVPQFNVMERWLGTGDTLAYTFDFTIYDVTHLLIYIQDQTGAIVGTYRGDDTTFLAGVVFDAINGGGTITLQNFLFDTYVITAMLANDAPTQPSQFQGKFSFTLAAFEAAMDYITSALQRVSWLSYRAVRLHDTDDGGLFDTSLPVGAVNNPGASVCINPAGTGFQYGATLNQILGANAAAASATASAASALISANAAAAAVASLAGLPAGVLVQGTRGVPIPVTTATVLVITGPLKNLIFIVGSPGVVTVAGNPQLGPGSTLCQGLVLIGTDDTKTVSFVSGNGLLLNGNITIGNGDVLTLFWDGTNWQEESRSR